MRTKICVYLFFYCKKCSHVKNNCSTFSKNVPFQKQRFIIFKKCSCFKNICKSKTKSYFQEMFWFFPNMVSYVKTGSSSYSYHATYNKLRTFGLVACGIHLQSKVTSLNPCNISIFTSFFSDARVVCWWAGPVEAAMCVAPTICHRMREIGTLVRDSLTNHPSSLIRLWHTDQTSKF